MRPFFGVGQKLLRLGIAAQLLAPDLHDVDFGNVGRLVRVVGLAVSLPGNLPQQARQLLARDVELGQQVGQFVALGRFLAALPAQQQRVDAHLVQLGALVGQRAVVGLHQRHDRQQHRIGRQRLQVGALDGALQAARVLRGFVGADAAHFRQRSVPAGDELRDLAGVERQQRLGRHAGRRFGRVERQHAAGCQPAVAHANTAVDGCDDLPDGLAPLRRHFVDPVQQKNEVPGLHLFLQRRERAGQAVFAQLRAGVLPQRQRRRRIEGGAGKMAQLDQQR